VTLPPPPLPRVSHKGLGCAGPGPRARKGPDSESEGGRALTSRHFRATQAAAVGPLAPKRAPCPEPTQARASLSRQLETATVTVAIGPGHAAARLPATTVRGSAAMRLRGCRPRLSELCTTPGPAAGLGCPELEASSASTVLTAYVHNVQLLAIVAGSRTELGLTCFQISRPPWVGMPCAVLVCSGDWHKNALSKVKGACTSSDGPTVITRSPVVRSGQVHYSAEEPQGSLAIHPRYRQMYHTDICQWT
jgi:hypothetical protein